MLDCLARAGVDQTVVVVGYLADAVRAEIGGAIGPMRIVYRANADFASTNTSRSLAIGLEGCAEDVLVLEGDVYFEQRVLDRFLCAPYENATLVEPWHPGLTGSVVRLAPDGSVGAWLHEKDRVAGDPLDGTFKTVNVHRWSAGFVDARLRPALASESGREPIETVIKDLVSAGARIQAVNAAGPWCEIDDESDLIDADGLFSGAIHGSR